jgi:hypothetical protein
MKRYRPGSREYGAASTFKAAEKKLVSLQRQLDAFDLLHGQNLSTDCVAAFVVFNCEDSQRFCLKDYAGSDSWRAKFFQVGTAHRGAAGEGEGRGGGGGGEMSLRAWEPVAGSE